MAWKTGTGTKLCWRSRGPEGKTRREAYLEALWRLTTGEEPIVMDGWTNEESEGGACVVGAHLAACYWIHTKAVEVSTWVALRREDALMESVTRLCLRVIDNHVWVTEFTLVLFWRVWDITLRCLG